LRQRGLFHLSSAFLYIILPENGPLQSLTHARVDFVGDILMTMTVVF